MTLDDLKSQLKRFRIKPDRRLGQNFLLSDDVLADIVSAAELKSSDTVLEIGPGLGVLTKKLADQAGEVIAVEKDRQLARVLRQMFRNRRNLKIIQDDALFFDPTVVARIRRLTETKQSQEEIAARPSGARNDEPGSYKLVANLPYYLTGAILEKFLTGATKPSLMVLLLQKEVAERIVARPGDMSILGVSVQFYADPEIIRNVGKENFYPMPAVDSAVVRLRVLPGPRFDVTEKFFFQIVKAGFRNKRKQLHNNLSGLFPHLDVKGVLRDLGLNPLARAQDLSLQDWHRLYEKLKNERT